MPDYEIVFNVNVASVGDRNVVLRQSAVTLEEAIAAAKIGLVIVTTLVARPAPQP